jgi:aspartyl-tRNA(Asn)/glutamyl-tRNA(Gln) amidotransferase subunit B
MHSPEEAGAYVRKVRSIVRYLETCDGNMEEGSMRADVNVSVRPVGATKLWTRTDPKNVNSVRFMMPAIEFEAQRQVEVWETGGEVKQQTRLFDPDSGETRSMRSKEEAHDYRYFPCPDLLPIELTQSYVDDIKATMPELPDAKKHRFMSDNGLSAYDADVLVAEREVADYFEIVAKGRDAKVAANWVISNLFGALKGSEKEILESPVSAENLGKLLDLLADDTISGRIAKDVFEIMFATGQDPAAIVEEKGLKQITDTGAIEAAVDQAISENPEQADEVRAGNGKAIGWFVGQVMQKTQGKANPQVVNKLLRDKLGG